MSDTSPEALQIQLAQTQAQLDALVRERDDLGNRLAALEARLEDAQRQLQEQERKLGMLDVLAQRVDQLQNERDAALQQLVSAQASLENEIGREVKAALDQAQTQQDAAAAAWENERQQLRAQIAAQAQQPAGDGAATQVHPQNIAEEFRNVLERMAAPEPEPGRPFTAGLTHLEVEARGVFTATAPTEENPTGTIGLLPVDAAAVQPEALSTVRMRFSLVPNLTTGGAGGGPAPGA